MIVVSCVLCLLFGAAIDGGVAIRAAAFSSDVLTLRFETGSVFVPS